MKATLRKFSRLFAVLVGMVCFGSLNAQLTTSNALTPAQLVQQVLLGPGIIASNITYTGYVNAIGEFHNGNSGVPALGIDSGVVMTNGTILANDPTYGAGNGPQGPNNSPSAGVDNGQPGDPDVDVVAGAPTHNACVLQFDFVAQADSVKFNYVFGTDEYMEYVSGGFADAFAFILSGVSTPLPPTNIALIPSTTTPVTALNVNANVNPQYYVSNENPQGTTIQYDGFTVVLTAKYPILCGETYHIKLACADALDGIVDGGVFLQAGSFTTGQVVVSSQISYGGPNDSTLYEGCGQACIILSRSGNLANSDTANISLGGTASAADYSPAIPSQVIFQPGQDSIVICLTATPDAITEGPESLIFTSTTNGICTQSITSMTLFINEISPMSLDLGPDTNMCVPAPITITPNISGGVQPYTYLWSNGATTPTITVSPSVTTSYSVVVSDPCGSTPVTDSITVIVPPIITVSSHVSYGNGNDSTFYEGCGQACVYFVRTNTLTASDTAYVTLGGTASAADYSPALPSQVIFPPGEDTLVFCINAINDNVAESLESLIISSSMPSACAQNTNSTSLYISDLLPINVSIGSDTMLCTSSPVTFHPVVTGGVQPYTYLWSTGATTQNLTVSPSITTSYYVTVTDPCGSAAGSDTVTIFFPASVVVSSQISSSSVNDSTAYEGCGQACIIFHRTSSLGVADTATIALSGTASGADYSPAIPGQVIFPVGVDSVIFCIGALQDNLAEGLESLVITSTTPGGCPQSLSSTTFYISDVLPLSVNAGTDTTLCVLSTVNLNALASGGVLPYNFLWSNGATTAGTTVSPSVTTTYFVTLTDPCGTPAATDSVTIYIPFSAPLQTFPSPDQLVCISDPATISVAASGGAIPYAYSWSTVFGNTLPNPNSNSNTFVPASNGMYLILTTDACGNMRLDTINVNIHDCTIIPPNVFTPNGDGVNDDLVFFGLENFPGTSLQVFNRWGEKIYESDNYQNNWNGGGVVDGTYYYILIESDGTTLTGFLTVIK